MPECSEHAVAKAIAGEKAETGGGEEAIFLLSLVPMNRRKALLRMGWIMAAGIYVPLISWFVFANTKWIFYLLFGYMVWIIVFGKYIKRMVDRINRDYPKEDNSN